jgi:hypothetical protein
VSFHYIKKTSGALSHSATFGLGAAFNGSSDISPVVIGGYSLLVHQNFGVSIGMAGHLVNRLKGKFEAGQQISTNLESTDLTEKVIGFNPFVSITFRFGSNPFSVKKVTEEPKTTATDTE